MSKQTFKAGDVVRLKSGGPKMTILWIEDEYGVMTASCQWFDSKNELKDAKFRPSSLEHYEADTSSTFMT